MKYVELGNLNIPIVQPKKGVDYYTDIEKEEIIEEVSKRVNSTIEPMENERQTSETQRESNEEVRNSQENTRQVNESERISNETIRQNNEDIRLNNENLRLSNEQNRVEAEELRNANFVNQMSKNEEALQNIKDMTVEYNENAVSKVLEFNNNCQVRTEDFNNNAEIQKGNFDANANEKIAQYNAHVSELTEDISNIKYEQNLQNTKLTELENKNIEQDTEISNLKQEDITQNTNIQNNAKGLEELQQENIKLKEKLEKQNSQIPTGQASGENITINDSSDLPFEKFKITGNSKQKTRKGINLFNKDNISNFANASQGYLVEGTKVKSYFIQCKPNTTYSAKRVTPNTDRFSIAFTSEVPAEGVAITNIYPNPPNVDQSNNDVVISSTSAEDSQYVCITISNSAQEVPDIMLVEGLYTNENFPEYEAYGASPSSDYPSEIQNVTSVNVEICAKNLFDKSNYNLIKGYISNNVIVTETNNDMLYIPCFPNKNYTVSKKAGQRFAVAYSDTLPEISNSVEGYIFNSTASSITITTGENAKYLVIWGRNANISGEITLQELLDTLQIEIGTEATDYEEYQSQIFSFPLEESQKMYKDSYLADDGIHHVRNQIEFDGTENWQVSDNKYYIGVKDKASRTTAVSDKILCNYFAENKTGYNGNTTIGKMFENYYTTGNRNVFFNYDDGEGGVDNFNTVLATKKTEGNPMILEYELGEEVVEAYTEEQQSVYDQIKEAYSYKNVTNIFSLDEVGPILEVTYKKDLETMFNNINNAILGGN